MPDFWDAMSPFYLRLPTPVPPFPGLTADLVGAGLLAGVGGLAVVHGTGMYMTQRRRRAATRREVAARAGGAGEGVAVEAPAVEEPAPPEVEAPADVEGPMPPEASAPLPEIQAPAEVEAPAVEEPALPEIQAPAEVEAPMPPEASAPLPDADVTDPEAPEPPDIHTADQPEVR
jgi:hypothetical protein